MLLGDLERARDITTGLDQVLLSRLLANLKRGFPKMSPMTLDLALRDDLRPLYHF